MAAAYTVLYLYVFLFGACIGSFVNVAALRGAEGRSFVRGRSACPRCGERLRLWDLVPLFSWIFLRGRCRYCHAPIPPRYFLVEAASGGLFALAFWRYGPSLLLLETWVLIGLLLCVFLIDLDSLTIPNGLVLGFLVPAALELLRCGFADIAGRLIGLAAVSVPLLLLALLIPDSFGGGDIKLLAVCGFLLGWQRILAAAFLAVLACGLYAAVLLLSKRAKRGDHIAFGPWLSAGILASWLFYTPMMEAYFSLFRIQVFAF